jgi:hypothetical protein
MLMLMLTDGDDAAYDGAADSADSDDSGDDGAARG